MNLDELGIVIGYGLKYHECVFNVKKDFKKVSRWHT